MNFLLVSFFSLGGGFSCGLMDFFFREWIDCFFFCMLVRVLVEDDFVREEFDFRGCCRMIDWWVFCDILCFFCWMIVDSWDNFGFMLFF